LASEPNTGFTLRLNYDKIMLDFSLFNSQKIQFMTIYFYGLNTIRLQDGGVSVLLDPVEETKASLRTQNDLILLSAKNEEIKKNGSFVINAPGEYEVKGIFVYAFNPEKEADKLVYVVEMEGMKMAHLGGLKVTDFSEKDLERLGNADILLISVGGENGYTAKQAVNVVNQFEPRIVVPINYAIPDLKVKRESLEVFKKESGAQFETTDKFKIAKKDLPEEKTHFVIIESFK